MQRFQGSDIGSAVLLLQHLGEAFAEIDHPGASQAQHYCRITQAYLAELGVQLGQGHDLQAALAAALDNARRLG